MDSTKAHPAVVAMFVAHQCTAKELAILKADRFHYEDTVNVRSMLARHLTELALRLKEWGWLVRRDSLVPVENYVENLPSRALNPQGEPYAKRQG